VGEPGRLSLKHSAVRELEALPLRVQIQVGKAIERIRAWLLEGEPLQDRRPIKGRADTYRVDSGEYRIIFEVNPTAPRTVLVTRIGHRREVYRHY